MGKTGVCPIRSEELVEFALNALREKGALDDLPEETYRQDATRLKKLLPDHYLPDIYLDLPLKGGYSGMAAIFDCYDRCYADFASDGEYFTGIGAEPMKDPENRDDLLVMKVCDSGVGYSVRKRKLREASALTEYDDLSGFSFLNKLKTLPVSFEIEPREDGFRLIFTTGRSDARKRFSRKPFKNEIIQLLAEAGCEKEALGRLGSASFNCGAPFLDSRGGYSEWYICLDVAAFIIEIKDGKVSESHAVIRISDRSMIYSRIAIKRTQAYQWHITDNCDQRCRHCYLFAEDARLKCVTTPWEQLMLTLDKITEDAAYRYGLPMPAISGGDPLLHPDFWRFAKELHRRGIHWDIMGNPFHLNEEVCHRLYGLGCFKYQLSLDGLREYHDHMRKPGSFQATLDAVKLLNDAGIQTQLMATVSRQNMQDVLECMDIAAEHNVTDFTFARYCATSPEKAEESYPSPEEYRDFLYSYYRKA
ncbi:MAG: radical SAM protein, partial [Lachnospiraceae bacterium]|nr:radical SAM protein [Lachnospiraceae bacterium]